MKSFLFSVVLLCSYVVSAQDRLSFVKDESLKKQIEKSIDFLDKTNTIPREIKSQIIFITFDIDKLKEVEMLGFNFSTYIPLLWGNVDDKGQFISGLTEHPNTQWLFFNYSSNLILVFRVFVLESKNEYFDQDKMKQLSNEVQIRKENIPKSEFFKYIKGNEYSESYVENAISLDKIGDEFVPVRVNTFDLKTFMEVWYGLDVKEITVGQKSNNNTNKQDKTYKFHTHPASK